MTHKFSICLYQPDMPQNVAVAIRTAACLGFPLHIVKPLNFSISDKRFRGAVMDYINYCDLKYHESWDVFFDFLVHPFRAESFEIFFERRPATGVFLHMNPALAFGEDVVI